MSTSLCASLPRRSRRELRSLGLGDERALPSALSAAASASPASSTLARTLIPDPCPDPESRVSSLIPPISPKFEIGSAGLGLGLGS